MTKEKIAEIEKMINYQSDPQATNSYSSRGKREAAQKAMIIIKELQEELRKKEDKWQPIETAPKDRTKILGFTPYGVETVHFNEEHEHDAYKSGWWGCEQDSYCMAERHISGSRITPAKCQPTHWMPLPEFKATTKQ